MDTNAMRRAADDPDCPDVWSEAWREAADEIERLREAVVEAYNLLMEAAPDTEMAWPEWIERCDIWMDKYPPSKIRTADSAALKEGE